MKIIVSPAALADLGRLQAYIAEDNPAAAHRVARTIRYGIENILAVFPEAGRSGRITGTRELAIPKTPIVLLYRVRRNTLEIIRVYHHAQHWPDQS